MIYLTNPQKFTNFWRNTESKASSIQEAALKAGIMILSETFVDVVIITPKLSQTF
jgi:hypothetical protein